MLSPLNNALKSKNGISFTSYGKVVHLPSIKKISQCRIDGVFNFLNSKLSNDFIQTIGNETQYLKPHSFIDTLKYPFVDLPRDILNAFATKFNIKSLLNSNLLKNYARNQQGKSYQRAMRGLLKNGDNFINQFAKKNGINPKDIDKFVCENKCNADFQSVCNNITKKLYALFDDNLAKDKAHYHTPHERTIVRLVSGITAAVMLGNDFYNKSIMNGVTEKEAIDSAKTKRKQEILATVQEAVSQYFLLGAFASFSNNSKIGAPLLNTALGILFHITSRISTGRELTRIKINDSSRLSFLSINKFIDNVKENKTQESINKKEVNKNQEDKKHLLSLKNILLATGVSIGVGFALKGIKSTKIFNNRRVRQGEMIYGRLYVEF